MLPYLANTLLLVDTVDITTFYSHLKRQVYCNYLNVLFEADCLSLSLTIYRRCCKFRPTSAINKFEWTTIVQNVENDI